MQIPTLEGLTGSYIEQSWNAKELGKKAKARLQELIDGGSLELIYVRCSCPEETYGTERCNFGRPCAVLRSHGRDVGDILIAEG
jgi:micrococcal nuclease